MSDGNPEVNVSDFATGFDADIEEIYVNGFDAGFSNADFVLNFKRNNRPVLRMNMSFTLAKTLGLLVQQAMAEVESSADIKINTTKEFEEAFLKSHK